MNSDTTKEFWKLYQDLPVQVRQQARASYQLFVQNPRHPGSHFKCVDENSATYSVRVGLHYRALGLFEDNLITWWWIGTHGEYDRILDML